MKVLIVEDNARVRQIIRSVIADLADEVIECADGSEAVLACMSYRPDWVLMDIKMPRVDGLKAAAQICAACPDARIMMVTNYEGEDLREAARVAGASEYVIKEDLLAIRRILLREH
jgi:CheY-like chemotaxis protein